MSKKVSRAKSGARKSRGVKASARTRPKAGAKARAKTRPRTAVKAKKKAGTGKRTTAASKRPAGNVVVTVGESAMPRIRKVAAKLRSRGMKIDSVLESTGHITGSLPGSRSSLDGIDGVAAVEKSPQFQLPPPDSDVQ